MASIKEIEHPFNEQDVCNVKDLWHNYNRNHNDVPTFEHGQIIPCLVRRRKILDNDFEIETLLDHYYVKSKCFDNTPMKRVLSWCYIEDLEPVEDEEEQFTIKERGDFFYSAIDIKDNFDEYFRKLDKDKDVYKELFNTFKDYEEDLGFIGESSIPIEDLRWWGFRNRLHLYVIRFGNNGLTLLASRNQALLELAIGMDNKTRFLKIR